MADGYESRDGFEAAVLRAGAAAYECATWEPATVDHRQYSDDLLRWVCPDCVLVVDGRQGDDEPFWETCAPAAELRDACEVVLSYETCWDEVPL